MDEQNKMYQSSVMAIERIMHSSPAAKVCSNQLVPVVSDLFFFLKIFTYLPITYSIQLTSNNSKLNALFDRKSSRIVWALKSFAVISRDFKPLQKSFFSSFLTG